MSMLPYDEYLKKFWEQKRLEEYQQRRKLPRPATTKLEVAVYAAVLILLTVVIAVILCTISSLEAWLNLLILVAYLVVMAELYGRFLAIKLVECYQHYASDEKRRKCKCVPSCSEYAILCFKKYEVIYALLKIRKRLFVTCKGFDYIIDNP